MRFPARTRCSLCNGKLKKSKEFWTCTGCNQLYWHGSHWAKIKQMAKDIKK
jgi:uncharacterized protein with PIN domain